MYTNLDFTADKVYYMQFLSFSKSSLLLHVFIIIMQCLVLAGGIFKL